MNATLNITIRNIGTSLGVILPKNILSTLNVSKGDKLEMSVSNGTITLIPQTLNIREGWRELVLSSNYKEYNQEELLPDYPELELEEYL
jgi:antitoxin component of MazEF toxin-antitoxin module